MTDLPVVVIAGRPNVGKSTLFNKLAGRRSAIVSDTPGVTRDRKEAEALLRGKRVRLIDTAGLEEAAPDTLYGRMRASSEAAVALADLVVFVVDAKVGITPADTHFANWLRRDAEGGLIKDDWRPTRLRFGEVVWNGQPQTARLDLRVGEERSWVQTRRRRHSLLRSW